MDSDDDGFQGHNPQLAAEFGHPLHGHLNFNSLVEREVFLGQEDNQWIDEYSRGSSGIEFNSGGVESRRHNVWSAATSLEMLLKSVGQEEKVVGKAVTEHLDSYICDESLSLNKAMDPNLNQESQISSGELDAVIINEKDNSSVLEEIVDNIFDDVSLKEPNKDHPGSSESVGVSVGESNATGLSKNVSSGAAEESIHIKENSTDGQMDSDIVIFESCVNRVEKSSFVPNVEYVDNPSAETSILVSENLSAGTCNLLAYNPSAENSLPSSENLSTETGILYNETSITLSGNPSAESSIPFIERLSTKTTTPFCENPPTETSIPTENSIQFSESPSQVLTLKDPDCPKSNAGSLFKISPIKISSLKEKETVIQKDAQQINSNTSMASTGNLPETVCESSGSVHVDCKITPSELGAIDLDQDDSFNEKEDANLALESNDMDIEVVQADDSQKNVESSLQAEGNKENTLTAYNIESDVSVQVERVSGLRSSPDTATTENYEQPKSPIFGVSLVHQASKENTEVGCPFEENSQNVFLQVESVVASVSKNPSAFIEKEASPDVAIKTVREIDTHCVTSTESCNASQIEQELETKNDSQDCFKNTDKAGNDFPTGCLQDPKESMIKVNDSSEHQASVDVAHPSDIRNDVANKERSVSLENATPKVKNITFEANKRTDIGQDDKGSLAFATCPVSDSPKMTDGPSKDSSSNQMDLKKSHEVSVSPQNLSCLTSQLGVKGKSERKPRRKSDGKGNTRKGTTTARDPVRGKISPVLLTAPAKPGVVLSSPKIPDLNNSTYIFQQPFTDDQQVQLRGQILVYGSLISGIPPEETHMIAAFGQSDGGRTWDSVWRACSERFQNQKSQPKSSTPIQSRSDTRDAGSRSDQVTKHASIQNVILSSPIGGPINKGTPPFVNPMIPFSSPLWNSTTSSDNLQSSGMAKTAQLTLSPLRPSYQTPPLPILNCNSWLSQGPFSGHWLAASPVPTFNPTAHFPSLPITESVKLTPVKELDSFVVKHASNPTVLSSAPITSPEASSVSGMKRSTISSDQSFINAKSKKKKMDNPVVSIPSSTSVGVSMPAFMTSKSSTPARSLSAVALPTHHAGDQNMDKFKISEETLTKVEESKLQAKEATEHADSAMFHCNGVWSQLQRRYNYDLNSNDEAKLVSSAVSVAAAASVAKVAATAAKIASDISEQARLLLSDLNRGQNIDQSKATSASLKHTENLDAIVKAAKLAAEAVSQAGKIVAMTEPFSLRHLVEAGPEAYWKTPRLLSKQQAVITEKLDFIETRNAETASDKRIQATDSCVDLMENQTVEVDGTSVLLKGHVKDKRKPRARKGSEVFKSVRAVPESEIGSIDTPVVGQTDLKIPSGNLIESDIKEGCLVEVYKDDDKHNGAWFGGKVLSLKDGKALVSYTEIQSDEGSEKFKEWFPLEVEGSEVPMIRLAHPVSTVQGSRKRRRAAATDFIWSSGDRVDVWIQDHWREGVVTETNKVDATSLTVQFPAEGETSVVRSWFVRPTLIWKDDKWIMCHTSEKRLSSPGNMQQKKRLKLGSPIVESKRSTGQSESIDLIVDLRKQEESRSLSLSAQESVFSVGSTRDSKVKTHRTTRSGLQKEGPGVTFGVPRPGKKQKFMDVSKHYVAGGSNIATHDAIKFTKYLIPHPPGSRGWKNNSRSELKEKQAVDTKQQMLKSRKPPIPSVRTLYTKSSINKSSLDFAGDAENQSGQEIQMQQGYSSTTEIQSERLKKQKFVSTTGVKAAKVESPLPELVEPRRSNRKIQPTSRLLEGLQSSMTISKMPAPSPFTQRSHNKVTSKGTMAEKKESSNKDN